MQSLGFTTPSELGLGGLWVQQMMTLATMANLMVDEGTEITGASMYERLGTSDDLVSWPNETPMACGSVSSIPSVCNFVYPIGTYVEGRTSRRSQGSRRSTPLTICDVARSATR